MLTIRNLRVKKESNEILKGIDITFEKGKTYAIMGPNGSGKSTLASALAGSEDFEVDYLELNFLGKNLANLSIAERAAAGLFIGFQSPVEIPGVSSINFLKAAINESNKTNNRPPISSVEFMKRFNEVKEKILIKPELLRRGINEGFSGGEKKRNEVFQMLMLKPKIAILDEIDSGLDVDSLKEISNSINSFRSEDNSLVLITHYNRILDLVTPDEVFILNDGKIAARGGASLAKVVEKNGYEAIF